MSSASPVSSARAVGPALVVVGLLCQEGGAAVAVLLFPQVGPVGMVAFRLVFSALILLAAFRPRLRRRVRLDYRAAALFGLVLAAMNIAFYLSLERLPLGVAVTIETLGPLVLSVIAGRRWAGALWAALALAGVALLGGGVRDLDPLGVVFAVIAAVLWAAYILSSRAVGQRFDGLDGLALATALGGLATIPVALAVTPDCGVFADPAIITAGIGVAVLSSTIPYAFEMLALRRMPPAVFAVLLALAPAVAALLGAIVLRQLLTPPSITGIACVVGASIGAIRTAPAPSGPSPTT